MENIIHGKNGTTWSRDNMEVSHVEKGSFEK